MVRLIIDNSYSKIEGLTVKQFNSLRKLLSYTSDPQAAYYSGGFAKIKYCIDTKGNFPTGLLNRVQKHLSDNMLKYVYFDKRVEPAYQPGMFKLRLS